MSGRAFIKIAGGKTKLVPQILELFPAKFTRYFELFCGGAAVYWAIADSGRKLKTLWLNDVNEALINVYACINGDVERLIRELKSARYRNTKECFLDIRAHFRTDIPPGLSKAIRYRNAADYIYINKVCFNGIYRVNSSGGFNVPFGDYPKPNWCDEENLRACAAALLPATLDSRDFAALPSFEKGDCLYLDPPYVPRNTTSDFTSYTAAGFGPQDQIRLRDFAVAAKKKGAFVLLSNSDTPLVRSLYVGWKLKEVQMARSINSSGDKRGKVGELLIY